MTILWNGLDAGLAPAVPELMTSVIDPLPYRYTVQQGFRSIAQQNALYAKGRNAQGVVIAPQDTVTNAKGGQSAHNFGCAIDVYPIVNGKIDWGFDAQGNSQPSPEALPAWQALWDAVHATDTLVTGSDFKLASGYDPGHVEVKAWAAAVEDPNLYDSASQSWLNTPLASDGSGVVGASPPSADGDAPTDGPAAPPSLVTTVYNWLELDPGVTIGFAAIVGLLVFLRLRQRYA